jgi:hypothetical protein
MASFASRLRPIVSNVPRERNLLRQYMSKLRAYYMLDNG